MNKLAALAASAAAALMLSAPAFADRGPVAAEQAEIAKSLKAAGYVSWQGIEFDADGPLWEVDGARKADRTKWDVKLEAGSYKIVREKRD
jgi:hypothetical protein